MKMTDCHGVTCKYLCGSGWWCNCRALNVWNATRLELEGQPVSQQRVRVWSAVSHWAVLPKRTSGWGQSGFIAGIQAQAAFLCWVSLVYQKAIWLACVPAAPLSTRQRACPSTLINCCTELCLFKFQRTVQGMWESMDMLIKSLTSSSLIYTCAPDTAHGGWWLGTQAAGCKNLSHWSCPPHPLQPHQAGSNSYLCPICLTWKRAALRLLIGSCELRATPWLPVSFSPAQIHSFNKD